MSDPASILVVDDDVDTCRNLSDILTDLGYRVDVAHDGASALEHMRRRPYDVALLDLKMPDMDGVSLYREMRKIQASAVALVITAFAGAGVTEEALAAGAWKVLSKPVRLPDLLGLVETAVEQPLVLVIDDDAELCSNLWDLLRDQGFRVGMAHSEPEAAERLTNQDYRVVLIDMKLPPSDGSSVFRLVRTVNPLARTVVITGHREELDGLVRQVISEGADAVCYKPFDVAGLLSKLRELTSRTPPDGEGR
jgi:two-component system response regulator HydG